MSQNTNKMLLELGSDYFDYLNFEVNLLIQKGVYVDNHKFAEIFRN